MNIDQSQDAQKQAEQLLSALKAAFLRLKNNKSIKFKFNEIVNLSNVAVEANLDSLIFRRTSLFKPCMAEFEQLKKEIHDHQETLKLQRMQKKQKTAVVHVDLGQKLNLQKQKQASKQQQLIEHNLSALYGALDRLIHNKVINIKYFSVIDKVTVIAESGLKITSIELYKPPYKSLCQDIQQANTNLQRHLQNMANGTDPYQQVEHNLAKTDEHLQRNLFVDALVDIRPSNHTKKDGWEAMYQMLEESIKE